MSNRGLTHLPDRIGDPTRFDFLDVQRNELTELPDRLFDPGQLTTLDVSSNELTELASAIGQLRNLTTLLIGGNPILTLPDEITELTISGRLRLPQFFDVEAQSPAVQQWHAERQRQVDLRNAARSVNATPADYRIQSFGSAVRRPDFLWNPSNDGWVGLGGALSSRVAVQAPPAPEECVLRPNLRCGFAPKTGDEAAPKQRPRHSGQAKQVSGTGTV